VNAAYKIAYKYLIDGTRWYFAEANRRGHYARCYYDILMECIILHLSPEEELGVIKKLHEVGIIGFSEPPYKWVKTTGSAAELLKSAKSSVFVCLHDFQREASKVVCDDYVYLIHDQDLISDPYLNLIWNDLERQYKERHKLV
jgi:hypothetical protein